MNLYLATPDAAQIQKVFSAVLRDSHGVEVHLEKWTAHLLAEREKRRILRYDLVVRAPGAAQPHRHQWVGKFYAQKQNGVGARAAAVLRELAATDCRVRGNMALPEVIAYDAPLGLLLLRYEEGEPVLNVLAQHRTEILSAMGRALAALHTTAVIVEPETSPATLLADLRLRVAELCTRLPGEANTFRDGLTALERRSPAAPPCLLHGDFGAGQLVWQQHRLVVLDFDKCTRGDPAFDLGNLLTQLQRIAIREPATDHGKEQPGGRNRRSVWSVPTQAFAKAVEERVGLPVRREPRDAWQGARRLPSGEPRPERRRGQREKRPSPQTHGILRHATRRRADPSRAPP